MKKMNNKKGFTLAELLIVIAIIAILIAIAIPAFGGALENAKRQTDHANMRSAYAMYQNAKLTGVLYLDETETNVGTDAGGTYYFQKDGTLATGTDNAYAILTGHGTTDHDDCKSSIICVKGSPEKTKTISITVDGNDTTKIYTYALLVGTTTVLS